MSWSGGGGGSSAARGDDNSSLFPSLPSRAGVPSEEVSAAEESSRTDKPYCASIRRIHRIAPIFYKKAAKEEEQQARKNKIKIKTKTSPIRLSFRPNPGRTFDGFLGRFVKRDVRQAKSNRKPTLTTAAALKSKFSVKRASSKVSPGIVLHDSSSTSDPDPLMRVSTATTTEEEYIVDEGNQRSKANLLHTIKIYLHGNNTNKLEAIDADCCNPIHRDQEKEEQQQRQNNSWDCGEREPDPQFQLCRQSVRSDRKKFSIGADSTTIRDSVNTSLSIFCSAAAATASNRGHGEQLTKKRKPIAESAKLLLDNNKSGPTSIELMSAPTTTHIEDEDKDDLVLESLQDPNDTVVDLDSEFREVLHFNIGQSVRTPPQVLRSHLLRHVTSFESSDEETADQDPDSTESAKQWPGSVDGDGPEATGEEFKSSDLCVSPPETTQAEKPPKSNTPSRRLIPFNNLQDSHNDDEADKRIKHSGDSEENNVRSSELQSSSEEYYYSGSGFTELCSGGDGGGVDVMPAHGDLFIDPGDDTAATKMSSTVGKKEHLYKILVIGELGTGKTSFIKRYVHQFFSSNYRATIGVDFALKVIPWDENTLVRLQLWDIAGQERFGNMTRVYYKEAVGAFIVFDVTRQATFDAVKKWKQDLDSKVQLPDGSNIPCVLLANKCDQEKQGYCADSNKMDEFVKENDFIGWYETSAKDNINIDDSAKGLVGQILLNDRKIALDEGDAEKITLAPQAEPPNSKKCSC